MFQRSDCRASIILRLLLQFPKLRRSAIEDGMKTEFRLLQRPDKAYEGRLSSLDRAVDTKSRTVTARIDIANTSTGRLSREWWAARAYCAVRIRSAVVVPSTALCTFAKWHFGHGH
jgi:multidrug efflux pump subunit AcrA (membrane-fusion protein)